MIRFIDLRGSDTGYSFSFWDTVTDKYICVNGEYAWDKWDEFNKDTALDNEMINIERYKALCPEWAFSMKEFEEKDRTNGVY